MQRTRPMPAMQPTQAAQPLQPTQPAHPVQQQTFWTGKYVVTLTADRKIRVSPRLFLSSVIADVPLANVVRVDATSSAGDDEVWALVAALGHLVPASALVDQTAADVRDLGANEAPTCVTAMLAGWRLAAELQARGLQLQ